MIKLELTQPIFANLKILVTAGAKAQDTGENGIMAAAQILQILNEAQAEANKPEAKANGHSAEASPA